MRHLSGVLYFLLGFPLIALGESTSAPIAMGKSPVDSGAVLQLLLVLALIVGLILLLAWLAKHKLRMPMAGQANLKVVASLPLSPKDKLVVVEVGGQQLLLGVSPGRISQLHVLPEPLTSQEQVFNSPFAEKIKEALQKNKGDE